MRKIQLVVPVFALLVGFAVVANSWGQGRAPGGFPGGGGGGKGSGFPSGGKGGGFPGGASGFPKDANGIFEMYARGRPYIVISEARQMQGPLMMFAKEQGITNDQITREQFNAFYLKMDQYRASAFGGGKGMSGFSKGGPQGSGLTPPPGSPPIQPGQNPLEAIAAWAEADFNRRDQNGDKQLVPEEMSEQLRAQIDRWDTDHDGLISLDEYKVYYSARLQMRDGDPRGMQQPSNPLTILIEEDYDRRPDVIRAGKLPKELPRWFTELDADSDGQIALHEWHKAGKEIDEFKEWDRNDDALLTAEEVLFKQRANGGTSLAGNGNGFGNGFDRGSMEGKGPRGFGGGFGGGERPSGGFGGGGERPGGGFNGFGGGERPNMGQFNRGGENQGGAEERRKSFGGGGTGANGAFGGMFKKKGG
jgi:hypothetical protein